MNTLMLVARVVLQNSEGKFLFIKRQKSKHWTGTWSLPGGKLDYGERLQDTCKREILEETGLTIGEPLFVDYFESLPQEKDPFHYLAFYFTAPWSGTKVILNDESSEYAWLAPSDLDTIEFAFNQRAFIKQLLATVARK